MLFALPTALVGTTRPEWTSMLVYDTSTLQAWGAWTVGQTINAFGVSAYVMSGGALHAGLVYVGINGRVGVQSVILGSSASDNITGSEVRPPFVIWGPILPPKLKGNLYFQRLDVFATAPVLASGGTLGHLSYSLQYLTSLRPYRSNLSPAQAVWRRETDVSYISFRYVPTKASFGLNGYGRWILPVLTITEVDGSGNALGPWGAVIQGCRIEALVADAEPNAE